MSPLKAALPGPFVVFGIACIAFGTWLAHDVTHAPAAGHRGEETRAPVAPLDPLCGSIEARLANLTPGQPRLVVEEQLTSLVLPQVDPIDVSSGKAVCRERYTIHLGRPVPNLMPAHEEGFAPGPYTLTVEFDGTAPGHPLMRLALAPGALPPLAPVPVVR